MYDIILYKLAQDEARKEMMRRTLARQFVNQLRAQQMATIGAVPSFAKTLGKGLLGGALIGAATLPLLRLLRKPPKPTFLQRLLRRVPERPPLLPVIRRGLILGGAAGLAGGGLRGIYNQIRLRQAERELARNMLKNYYYQYKL